MYIVRTRLILVLLVLPIGNVQTKRCYFWTSNTFLPKSFSSIAWLNKIILLGAVIVTLTAICSSRPEKKIQIDFIRPVLQTCSLITFTNIYILKCSAFHKFIKKTRANSSSNKSFDIGFTCYSITLYMKIAISNAFQIFLSKGLWKHKHKVNCMHGTCTCMPQSIYIALCVSHFGLVHKHGE